MGSWGPSFCRACCRRGQQVFFELGGLYLDHEVNQLCLDGQFPSGNHPTHNLHPSSSQLVCLLGNKRDPSPRLFGSSCVHQSRKRSRHGYGQRYNKRSPIMLGVPATPHAMFSCEENREIRGSENSTRGRLRDGEDASRKELVVWNIGDGKVDDRRKVLQKVFGHSFSADLVLLQECTWKPHGGKKAGWGQHPFRSFSTRGDDFGSNKLKATFTKDGCNRYLVIAFHSESLCAMELPDEALQLRNQILPISLRLNVCIALLRYADAQNSIRHFFVLNVHAPRGNSDFVLQTLKLASGLYKLKDPRGRDYCSGVIWGGDFNQDLSLDSFQLPEGIVMVATDSDTNRPNRSVDFFGYVKFREHPPKVELCYGTIYDWNTNRRQLFSDEEVSDIPTDKKVLNHPILHGTLRIAL